MHLFTCSEAGLKKSSLLWVGSSFQFIRYRTIVAFLKLVDQPPQSQIFWRDQPTMTASPAEGVRAVGQRIAADLHQVPPKALKKDIAALWDYSQLIEKS